MLEKNEVYKVDLDIMNPDTGELHRISGTHEVSKKYYSIKNLTSRINSMNLFEIQEQICKSSKDIRIFRILLEMADKQNEIRISNIGKLAKDLDVSRQKLTTFLKSTEEVRPDRLTIKLDTGVYMVNPMVFTGKRIRSNEQREEAQMIWKEQLSDLENI